MRSYITTVLLAHISLLVTSVTTQATYISDKECQRIHETSEAFLFQPGDSEYTTLRTENWSETAHKDPACIFKPDNSNDLAKVVKSLQAYGIKFAIRSGGHSPSPDAANIDGGILIDLGAFDEVKYDPERHIATVGSGLRWEAVYDRLIDFNVTVVGGRVLEVGVGGLTLGGMTGGLSYLSDMYGLVCDNVVNFEVVLGSGDVVNVNQTNHPDLYWALKGGGNNFGIVTRFTLRTYPNAQVWGGVKAYTLEDLPALYNAMYEYQMTPQKDPKGNLMLQGYVSNETIGVVLNMIYLAPQQSPDMFKPFYHINTTSDTTKISSLTEFLSGQGPISFPSRIDWRATSFKPDKGLYGRLNSLMTDSAALQRIKNVQSGTVAFGMQPISTSAIEAGNVNGGNTLGLQHINQTWYVIDSGWSQKGGDDETVHIATKDIIDSIQDAAVSVGAHIPYIFMNDASYDQDVISGYGTENVAKMKAISLKYDPYQVFQELVPGGFKLPGRDS